MVKMESILSSLLTFSISGCRNLKPNMQKTLTLSSKQRKIDNKHDQYISVFFFIPMNNKICITKKGLELLRESEEIPVLSRYCSLPNIDSRSGRSSRLSYGGKSTTNQKLSGLSGALERVRTVGLRKLALQR